MGIWTLVNDQKVGRYGGPTLPLIEHCIDEKLDVGGVGGAVGVHVGPFAAGTGGVVVGAEEAVDEEVEIVEIDDSVGVEVAGI